MQININEEAIEEITYHTEDPIKIYNVIMDTIKPEILKFIEDVVKKRSKYPRKFVKTPDLLSENVKCL